MHEAWPLARELMARDRIVVSGHFLACAAADGILERGGSVADAAVAGAAVLSVVLPDACGLGGDALVLAHDAAEEVLGALLERGVMLPPSQFEAWFVSLAHDEALIDRTIEAVAGALREVADH